jgi:hypothetical protein
MKCLLLLLLFVCADVHLLRKLSLLGILKSLLRKDVLQWEMEEMMLE